MPIFSKLPTKSFPLNLFGKKDIFQKKQEDNSIFKHIPAI